jgi:hypothetical protein
VKKIIPYSLFEGTSNVNEKEVESIVTDICADFMDDHELSISFSWGWALENKVRKSFSGTDISKYGFKSDGEVKMFRDWNDNYKTLNLGASSIQLVKKYLSEVDISSRCVEVQFFKFRGSKKLNIWSDNIEADFLKCFNFTGDYFQNVDTEQSVYFNPDMMALRFHIIFL